MEKAMTRLGMTLCGSEVVRASPEYHKSIFSAMRRGWKAEIWHAGVVGHGKCNGQVGGDPPPGLEVVKASPEVTGAGSEGNKSLPMAQMMGLL